jgi:hypothetical protein
MRGQQTSHTESIKSTLKGKEIMIQNSVAQVELNSQWNCESKSAEVFCPMCEVMHENNTLCQMSWSD